MSAIGGMFSIIQAGQLGSLVGSMRAKSAPAAGSTDPSTWALKKGETAVEAFWRLAPDAAQKAAPTLELVKRLEKMKEGGNRDISAEKLRQAKAKLNALRQQLQMASAHGDPRQIKRLAAEAARLAREVGSAARDLSHSVTAGTTTYAADARTTQSTTDSATTASRIAADLTRGGERDAAFKELHQIGSDARSAITQAKGLIAQAAQMVRARRRANDDDEFFRELQQQIDAALDDVDAGQRAAVDQLLIGVEHLSTEIETTSVEISVTTIIVAGEESALGVHYA